VNDNELLDRLRSAPALTSMTPLAAVEARSVQITQHRHRLFAGAGAAAAIAAVAIAVPLVSVSHSRPAQVGSVGSSPTGRVLIRNAAYEVSQAPDGHVSAEIYAAKIVPSQLQQALNDAGVRIIVRVGPQPCAYKSVPSFNTSKVVRSAANASAPSGSPLASLVFTPSGLPAGTTLQIWFDGQSNGVAEFDLLPAGTPHC
jgi:hypothetical protein